MKRALPPCMYQKHGAYYLVKRNKWTMLGKTLPAALREYARLIERSGNGIDDLLDLFIADAVVKDSTMAVYRIAIKAISAAFIEFRPDQVTPAVIAQFLRAYKANPATANKYRTILKIAFDKAVILGMVPSNPVVSVPRMKEQKRTRYITDAEYALIKANAHPTLAAIMEMCLLTGQRIGDILKLRRSDIDDDGIYFEQEKTGMRMRISWSPELRAAVAAAKGLAGVVRGVHLFANGNGGKLAYYTVRKQWDTATRRAGVEDAHLHDLRAKAGTDTKAAGGDSKALLGHKSESSHARYLRGLEVPVVEPTRRKAS